jgi:hypothetical protein
MSNHLIQSFFYGPPPFANIQDIGRENVQVTHWTCIYNRKNTNNSFILERKDKTDIELVDKCCKCNGDSECITECGHEMCIKCLEKMENVINVIMN